MSERPFMQLYVSDFVGDTLQLSSEQVGAYMLLLMAMWNANGELPNDPAKLARVARVTADRWPEVWSDLAPFFTIEGAKITHGRVALELAKFARKSAARSEAGKRGAEAKSLKYNKPTQAIASGLLKHSSDTRIKKAKSSDLKNDGTEPVVLDRWSQEDLFKACERITGKPVPVYMQRKSFPPEVVAQARIEVASPPTSDELH